MKRFVAKVLKFLGLYYAVWEVYSELVMKRRKAALGRSYGRYKGQGWICNACGASYSKFAPFHPSTEDAPALARQHVVAGYGENILCPSCMSNARDRLVIAMLAKLDLVKKKVLYLAPEKNVFEYLTSRAIVQTADLVPGYYRKIDRTIQKEDATSLSYPDASFDLLIATHILEHIPDDRKAMRELHLVLKPGGQAVLLIA